MAQNNAPNRGRGRGRGRGDQNAARAAPPLAAQLRQVERLQEPQELKELRRFAPIGAIQIRSTYGLGGRLQLEIGKLDGDKIVFVSSAEAELALAVHERQKEEASYNARIIKRFAEADRPASYEAATDAQKRILRMSNKQFDEYSGRNQRPNAGGNPPPQAPPQQAGGGGA